MMMETETSFNARQHGKKQMILAQTLFCSTQTLYGFTQICVTISHTNILCGFLCDFREKHTNIQQIAQIYYE
jgi:hypothetical protein